MKTHQREKSQMLLFAFHSSFFFSSFQDSFRHEKRFLWASAPARENPFFASTFSSYPKNEQFSPFFFPKTITAWKKEGKDGQGERENKRERKSLRPSFIREKNSHAYALLSNVRCGGFIYVCKNSCDKEFSLENESQSCIKLRKEEVSLSRKPFHNFFLVLTILFLFSHLPTFPSLESVFLASLTFSPPNGLANIWLNLLLLLLFSAAKDQEKERAFFFFSSPNLSLSIP